MNNCQSSGNTAGTIGYGLFAGGRSSRMGEDKLFLNCAGKPMLSHVAEAIPADSNLYIAVEDEIKSAKCRKILSRNATFVIDEIKEYGPMEGLYQLLNACTEDALFVFAGDMPGITPEFIDAVLKNYNNEDALVMRQKDGRIHPLCAIYSKRILPVVIDFRLQDTHKIMRIYDKCSVRYICPEEIGFSDSVLININTPDDYERLILKK